MLKELINRARGQVWLRVTCPYPERVLNLCSARKLAFWDLEWEGTETFTCRMSRGDHRVLSRAAEKLDCTIEIVRREGAPYTLAKLRHRQALAVGIAVCGTAVLREGVNTNLRDISSVTVRIGREQPGLGDAVLPQLFRDGRFRSTVLLSPPGLGKTTLLRDLIRGLSDGVGGLPEHRVSVVDERGEIAVMYQGVPQMAVGRHTDVLDACPKAVGIPILLRAANPQVIAVDEITVREDLFAMAAAANCGVALLATIHADGRQELGRKPLFSQLLKARVFEKAVTIRREGEQRQYIVEELW